MNLDCQPHDHKHSIFISFLNDDHFLLRVSEMRVILVAFLSFAFAYAPNLSFLKELFRSLPSSGNISSNSIQYVTVCTILWISDYSILYKKQYRDTQKSDRDAIGVSWSEPSWISKGDATTLSIAQTYFRNEDMNHPGVFHHHGHNLRVPDSIEWLLDFLILMFLWIYK